MCARAQHVTVFCLTRVPGGDWQESTRDTTLVVAAQPCCPFPAVRLKRCVPPATSRGGAPWGTSLAPPCCQQHQGPAQTRGRLCQAAARLPLATPGAARLAAGTPGRIAGKGPGLRCHNVVGPLAASPSPAPACDSSRLRVFSAPAQESCRPARGALFDARGSPLVPAPTARPDPPPQPLRVSAGPAAPHTGSCPRPGPARGAAPRPAPRPS